MRMSQRFQHIAVLMGGTSAERAVSLSSGRGCADALRQRYRVSEIDFTGDVPALVATLRKPDAPEAVFNALHGHHGEDGTMQGLLDLLGMPYTHSGVRASATAIDKAATRTLFELIGLRVPPGRVVSFNQAMTVFAPPFVVKPVAEGSSVGVLIVRDGDNRAQPTDWRFGGQVLVEIYIPGRELTCAVVDDSAGNAVALAPLEIRPRDAFYTYDSKYADGGSDHLIPAPIPQTIASEVRAAALAAHQALGCRGVSRSDFRYDDAAVPGAPEGRLYILETNTQPGMTPTSLVPEIAAHAGIDFPTLVAQLMEGARCDGS
jgi:D-alanine-D-alanine ligase